MSKALKKVTAPAKPVSPIDAVRQYLQEARDLIAQILEHDPQYNSETAQQVARLVLLREVIGLTRSVESEYDALRKSLCASWLRQEANAAGDRAPYTCPGYSVSWYGQEKSFAAKEAHKRTDYMINVKELDVDHVN